MREPAVSVVVPSHGRPERLAALLESLGAQTLSPDRFEVVVVDDGSDPPVNAREVGSSSGAGLDLRLLRHEASRGPATARNTGWRAARAKLIAFTDDDCRPAPNWLESLLEAAAGDGAVIVQGRTIPDPRDGPIGTFSRTQLVDGPHLYEACNIAYSEPLLRRIGGFDESFRHPCGEDVELGRRAAAAGGRLVFSQPALVYHAVTHPSLASGLREAAHSIDNVRIVKCYPDLRALLMGRVFWRASHPSLLLTLALLVIAAATRKPWQAGVALGPYVLHHLRRYWRSGSASSTAAANLPRHLAIDLAELGAMVVGSVRHRTLVL